MECVRGNNFFEFAADFDPDFRRIVHSFLNSFVWLRGEIIRFKKKGARGIYFFYENLFSRVRLTYFESIKKQFSEEKMFWKGFARARIRAAR